jgi:hypothetical protein
MSNSDLIDRASEWANIDMERVVPDAEDKPRVPGDRKARLIKRPAPPSHAPKPQTLQLTAAISTDPTASPHRPNNRHRISHHPAQIPERTRDNELAERLQAGDVYATVRMLHSRTIKSRQDTQKIIADSYQIACHLRDNLADFAEFIDAADWGETGKLIPTLHKKNEPLVAVLRQVHGCWNHLDLKRVSKSLKTLKPFYEANITPEEFSRKIIGGGMDALRREIKAADSAQAACASYKITICSKLRSHCNEAIQRKQNLRSIKIEFDFSELDSKGYLIVRQAPHVPRNFPPMLKKRRCRPVKPWKRASS